MLVRQPRAISQISTDTKLPATTVARAIKWLTAQQLADRSATPTPDGVGAPLRKLHCATESSLLGIQVIDRAGEPATLAGTITDVGGAPIVTGPSRRTIASGERNEAGLLEALERFVYELRAEARLLHAEPLGVGIAIGGHVDDGVVRYSPGIPALFHEGGLDLAGQLQERTGLLVLVDNDITALTGRILLKDPGASEEEMLAVIAVLGSGIGGGLAAYGRVVRGAGGLAMEPGHLIVANPHLADSIRFPALTPASGIKQCRCGHIGCLESYAAPDMIVDRIQLSLANKLGNPAHNDGERLARLAAGDLATAAMRPLDDTDTTAIFDSAGEAVGTAIGQIVTVFNPNRVVLYAPIDLIQPGQGSAASGWLSAVRAGITSSAFATAHVDLDPIATSLTDLENYGAEAAACLLVERLISELESPRSFEQTHTLLRTA